MQMRKFASAITLGQEFDPGQLYRDTIERKFLFEENSEVLTYFDEMYRRGNELERLIRDLETPNLDEARQRELRRQVVASVLSLKCADKI